MFATKIRHAQFLLQRYPSIFSEFPQRHRGQPKVRCFTITLLVKLNEALDGAILVAKGLFTWREEDARTRRKILEGETTFPWEKFSSVWCSSRERIKHGGRKPQKYNLGPSALFTGVNHNNGNAKRNGRPLLPWLLTKWPAAIFFWFVPSTRILQAKTVYMALGRSLSYDPSTRKILALERGATLCL